MDRKAWRAAIHGVARSRTRLSNWTGLDNIQPWRTPFPIWNQSVVPCPVLTVVSWLAYRFLKRQVRWSGFCISFRIFHSLLWPHSQRLGIVNKAEIDVFGELSCFFDDPADVGNLICGSSAFSKTSLNIRKFTVHIMEEDKQVANSTVSYTNQI